jgi:NAD(P)-dependent dehydrogenase (short-subunit alcohol dehydrogenase family)
MNTVQSKEQGMSIQDRIISSKAAKVAVNPRGLADEAALRKAVEGKVVLVTGASFGLGEATALMLGRAGATVLVAARTQEKLDAVVHRISAEGGRAHAYAADLSDPEVVDELVAKVLADHGHVDILVNNAGKSMRRSVELQYERPHDFTRMLGINYLGPVRLVMGLLPSMRERGDGLIVNVSTIGVRIAPGPRWGVYQSTKGAFDTWLRSITPEIGGDGVEVSTLYMALMYTRMSAPTPSMQQVPGLDADEAAGLVSRAIVRRPREITPWWVRPAEFASVVARGPVAWLMNILVRYSDDTDSAKGQAQLPSAHSRARQVG